MKRKDIFNELGMNVFFSGDSFEYDIDNIEKFNEEKDRQLLDQICIQERLSPLGEGWEKLTYEDFRPLMLNVFRFDLVFTSEQRMAKDKAEFFTDQLLSRVDITTCRFYTNWSPHPWAAINGGSACDSLTTHTLDIAIVMVDRQKVVFTFLTGED